MDPSPKSQPATNGLQTSVTVAPKASGSPGSPDGTDSGPIDGGAESFTTAVIVLFGCAEVSRRGTALPIASTPMPSAGTNTFVPVPTSCGGPNVPPAGRKLAAAAPTSLRCHAATAAPVGPIATTGDDTPDASGCAIPHGPRGVRTHAEMLESGVWPLLQTAT